MKVRKGSMWSRPAVAIGGVVLLGASVAFGAGYAGELDTTFGGVDGIVTTSGIWTAGDVAIQPVNAVRNYERYLVAGLAASSEPDMYGDWVVLAYTPDGLLDSTFGEASDGTVRLFPSDPNPTYTYHVSLDDQNRVVTVGTSTVRTITVYGKNNKPTGTKSYTGMTVVRLTADGLLDTSFNGTGVATVWAGSPDGYYEGHRAAVVIPPSLGGGILAVGECHYVASPAKGRTPAVVKRRTFFAKFRDDGRLDTSFGPNGNGIAYEPRSSRAVRSGVHLQSDGKIVVTGSLDWPASPRSLETPQTDTPEYGWAVSRFDSYGVLDPTFGSDGRVILSGALAMAGTVNKMEAVDKDKILVVGDGSAADGGGLLARYHKDGTPDETFDLDGYASTPHLNRLSLGDLALQPDGSVVFCANELVDSLSHGLVGRFTGDGSPDPYFSGDGYAPLLPSDWHAYGVAEAADGIVVVGRASSINQIFVARYGK